MTSAVSLGRLLAPRAIALVGLPGDLSRPGGRPLHFLRRHGYPGRIHLVNPRHREIGETLARKIYKDWGFPP